MYNTLSVSAISDVSLQSNYELPGVHSLSPAAATPATLSEVRWYLNVSTTLSTCLPLVPPSPPADKHYEVFVLTSLSQLRVQDIGLGQLNSLK